MTIAHLLEDFARSRMPGDEAAPGGLSEEAIEAQRLESFEEGYKAGWDDAVAARDAEAAQISAGIAATLQDLSFTYNEAYAHMVKALEPLLERMVGSMLPALARDALKHHVLDELNALARELGRAEAIVHVAPGEVEALEPLVAEAGFPIRVAGDPELGEGQARLRFGEAERQVDLDEVLARVRRAVAAFCHETERELRHG